MDENTFISDKFNTWTKCKKRYYFKYIKNLNFPELENNYKLGKSVHSLIYYYLKGFSVDHLLNNADQDIKDCWNILKNSSLLENKVIASEWGFNCRIKNTEYWLNGRVDAIFYDESQKKYIIADWKTGQNIPKDPENSFQAMMYMYAFYNCKKDLKLDFQPEDLIFNYVKISNDIEIFPINFSQEKEQEYEEIFLNFINCIKNENNFDKARFCPIKNCQYKGLCKS